MSFMSYRAIASVLALGLSGQAVLADISAEDVWADWKAYFTETGYTVFGTETETGNGLAVTDLTMSIDTDEPKSSASITFSEVTFFENGDGTVTVDMPDAVPLRFSGEDVDGPFAVDMTLSQAGDKMTVSGTPGATLYDYGASEIKLVLDSFKTAGREVPEEGVQATLTLANIASQTNVTVDGARSYTQSLSADSMTYGLNFRDPSTGEQFAFSGQFTTLDADGSGMLPENMDPEDMAAMLVAGLSGAGKISFEAGSGSIVTNWSDGAFNVETQSQGGSLEFGLDETGLSYRIGRTALNVAAVAAQDSNLPFPVRLSMAESAFGLRIPVSQSDDPQPFGLSVVLTGLSISDAIWNILDPGAILPRDPADVVLDLTGLATLDTALFSPKMAMVDPSGAEAPGDFEALTINRLLLSFAGVEIMGDGDFTFDNETAAFGGMSAPRGILNLTVSGANGLLDNLVKLGFVTNEEAMSARTMMALLGVPGDTPDTLTSTIEIDEQGHVLANGLRISD